MSSPATSEKWDRRFLTLAAYIASWSQDPSTRTGAVIVRPNRSICSLGYNGFPQGMADTPELYANREEKLSRIIHCEINAQLFAHEPLTGYTVYTWPFASCDRCCVQLLQAGIVRFVWPIPSSEALSRWGAAFERTKAYIQERGVLYSELSFPLDL